MDKPKVRGAPDETNDSEALAENNEDGVSADGDGDGEPKRKLPKLDVQSSTSQVDLSFNSCYTAAQFSQELRAQWIACEQQDFRHANTGASLYRDPFYIGLLPNFLQHKASCKQLVDEMIEKVHWSRKQMDLYEFYQSTDLSNMAGCKLLTSFLQMLRRSVRPWLEGVTGLKLDYVSASCSMYTCGDYLLVHDDLLKDRQIAFVYYLSPWDNAEQWSDAQGGCLEIFSCDDSCFPQFPVKRKISPKNNQFAFFKVGLRSFHQVGEVTNFDYPRLTINGWFHGASNDELIADNLWPLSRIEFNPPKVQAQQCLELCLNELYLKANTRKSVQQRIEDNSEICLYEFFRREIYEQALEQLLRDDTLQWRRQGPANAHNYEVLELSSASRTVAQLVSLFSSSEMFALLRDYTDLDLAGTNAGKPTYSLELQRWSHGNYTVLGDGAICEENTLDLVYYLNASEGCGIITYLSPEAEEPPSDNASNGGGGAGFGDDEDDSVLLTITPVDNALNVVYRCEGTTKFTKYVSRNTPMDKGPVFVISCSYKE